MALQQPLPSVGLKWSNSIQRVDGALGFVTDWSLLLWTRENDMKKIAILLAVLLAMPAAVAASWGFMLPSGTGPNAIAWASNHIALPRMLKSGFLLDICGIPMIVLVTWGVAALVG